MDDDSYVSHLEEQVNKLQLEKLELVAALVKQTFFQERRAINALMRGILIPTTVLSVDVQTFHAYSVRSRDITPPDSAVILLPISASDLDGVELAREQLRAAFRHIWDDPLVNVLTGMEVVEGSQFTLPMTG